MKSDLCNRNDDEMQTLAEQSPRHRVARDSHSSQHAQLTKNSLRSNVPSTVSVREHFGPSRNLLRQHRQFVINLIPAPSLSERKDQSVTLQTQARHRTKLVIELSSAPDPNSQSWECRHVLCSLARDTQCSCYVRNLVSSH